jgi:hypothetical protein
VIKDGFIAAETGPEFIALVVEILSEKRGEGDG